MVVSVSHRWPERAACGDSHPLGLGGAHATLLSGVWLRVHPVSSLTGGRIMFEALSLLQTVR